MKRTINKQFIMQNEIFQTPPELMTGRQLEKAFDALSVQMKDAQAALLTRDGAVISAIDTLRAQDRLWYSRAVLFSLEDYMENQSSENRAIVLDRLFDMMFSGDRGIARISAEAAGRLLADVCESDMSIWSNFLHRALFVKKNETLRGKSFSEDPLSTTFITLYHTVREDLRKSVLSAYASYFKSTRWDIWTCLRLISGIHDIPVSEWGAMQRGNIGGFIRYFLRQPGDEVRVASFSLMANWLSQGWKPSEDFRDYLLQSFAYIRENNERISPAENELIRSLCQQIAPEELTEAESPVSDRVLFQDNLRTNHSWLFKLINLKILRQKYENASPQDPGFNTYAAHLLILLRLNPEEIIFRQAGDDLMHITKKLSDQQQFEIAKELFKVIETGYDPTGYVPKFLGRFFELISSPLQSELLNDIRDLAGSRDPEITGNVLETICCIAAGLASADTSPDHDQEQSYVMRQLVGMMSQSLYSDMEDVVRHMLFTIGHELYFCLPKRAQGEAFSDEYFADLAHNVMVCLKDIQHIDLLCHPLAIGNIASWMRLYVQSHPDIQRPVAFYSGTFDPFTNGHHAIVQELSEMGYQVFVNVHNFAWNRNIQPLLIRRQMAAMSVTDVAHAFVFPDEITVNTDNPKDLARLKSLFPEQKVWLVVRNALIESESVYQQQAFEGSIHSFPHIVLLRNEAQGYSDEANSSGHLTGEMITLRLPVYYEHMTAEEIRQNISDGKSIDGLLAPQVQNYIQRHGLYAGRRDHKSKITALPVDTIMLDHKCHIIYKENGTETHAASLYFTDFEDYDAGRCVRISGTDILSRPYELYTGVLLDETLIALQNMDYTCCICPDGIFPDSMLRQRGFQKDTFSCDWSVDMTSPIVVFTDLMTSISDTLVADERLRKTAVENASRLLEATSLLYPGNLILHINTEIMYYRLSCKISHACLEEGVEKICVPFGKILKYEDIPGVMVMPFNTEKRYDPDLGNFRICEKSGYPPIQTQISTIHSMDMPFVLVDDLFHKGYRIQKIGEHLKNDDLKEERVIVGIRSRSSARIANAEGYKVDSVYDVPNMKLWIIESDMLPYFASDKVEPLFSPDIENMPARMPSIYPILPYQLPSFLKDAPYDAVYALSYACMENARSLFETLEMLYEEKYHKVLTFARLEEVIDECGYPEDISIWDDIQDKPVTDLLKRDMLRLLRLKR